MVTRAPASLAAVALVVLAFLTVGTRQDPERRFLDALAFEPQPGHAGHVLAAGHRVCGDLHDGVPRADVIADAVRNGIGGDLYTTTGAGQVVNAAARYLCPAAPRDDLVRP